MTVDHLKMLHTAGGKGSFVSGSSLHSLVFVVQCVVGVLGGREWESCVLLGTGGLWHRWH